ncbi:endoxylanase [Polaribacter batillariae]|uniref:Endoxylanase n=1 Tax=Polaribacter batillariae TaxID=2808900 RepID=A0ABX7SZP4_9FLAO|nr:sugar-binding protein [Polaribacter batillariae]QTD38978.1 endoxylanase [Polaribacter batillariae]
MSEKYQVKKIERGKLIVSGKADSIFWNKAYIINGLLSPWSICDGNKTVFKALWDDDFFFFAFIANDSDPYIDNTDNSKYSINNSDRIELFFRTNSIMNPYYCLEIDPTPRIMDFKAKPNKNFDFNWNWPKSDIQVKSSKTNTNFIVEGKISIKSLITFNLLIENRLEVGVYRAKYTLNSNSLYEPNWFTWIDPKTKTPNFHTSSSFGVFILL